jgi:uncharacterized damage-inducible protein DinB
METIERYRRMLEYERWANARVIESIKSADGGFFAQASRIGAPPREVEAMHQRAIAVLGHLQWARRVWLARLGAAPAPGRDEPPTLERLSDDAAQIDLAWGRYLDRLSSADLDATVRYTTSGGRTFEQHTADILTHIFNHSSYHRGQIAMLVRQAGGEPAETDYIDFDRQTAAAGR